MVVPKCFHRPEIQFALQSVQKAALLTRIIQSEMVNPSPLTKKDRTPVTLADLASQAVVSAMMEESLPGAVLVGEESSEVLRSPEAVSDLAKVGKYVAQYFPGVSSENVLGWLDRGTAEPASRFWTLDPIDGTTGFLRKGQYAVGLALIENGRVQLGVLGCPSLDAPGGKGEKGLIAVGILGEGAWISPLRDISQFKQIHVSRTCDLKSARILRSFDPAHTNPEQIEKLQKLLGIQSEPVLMDSLAKYVTLARGEAQIYFRLLAEGKKNYKEYIWDQAPGTLILEEAGGRVTDLDGQVLDFSQGRKLLKNRGVLSTDGHLHEACLDALRKSGI